MKKRIIRILSSALIILLISTVAGVFCNHPYDNAERTINSFYSQQDEKLDYVIIGASCGYNDLIPVVSWKSNNLTGACLCLDSAYYTMYQFILEEAISKYENFVLLVDIDGFFYGPNSIHPGSSRIWIDCQKKNKNWLKAIEYLDREHRLEHYFPILRYHNQLPVFYAYFSQTVSDIKNTINPKADIMFGSNAKIENEFSKAEPSDYKVARIDDSIVKEPNIEVINVFERFLDKCNDCNLKDVVFISFPKMYSTDAEYEELLTEKRLLNYYKPSIMKYGYKIIDFNDEEAEIFLDYNDFADSAHLNNIGAEKVTVYISDYICDNYETIEKDETIKTIWDNNTSLAYEKYGFGNTSDDK